jgi:ABC-type dipeptide/oligopeptide/nickel transport system permease subunit
MADSITVPELLYNKKTGVFKSTAKRIGQNKTAVFGLVVLVTLTLVCVLSPILAPYTATEMDMMQLNAAPSFKHPFGTDSLGRDILSRLMYGGVYSLFLGFSTSILSSIAVIILGSIAGYFGRTVDNIILRICDVMQAIPGILLAIVISAVLGPGYVNTIFALAIGGIPSGIRLVRGQILSVRTEEYLEAALSVNCGSARIMFRHILPNILSPIIVTFTMGIGNIIMLAASLAFIGLGIQPPTPEWGAMIAAGRNVFRNYPWQIVFPGIFIFITVLSINLFGDGLRDALDPKLKK